MTTAVVRSILNHKNYDVWSSQIKTYLLAEDLWDIIDERIDERPKTEDEEKAQGKALKKKNAKALYAIQNSCGDDTYELIKDETTAKGAWDTLSEELKKRDPSDEKDERSVSEAYPTLSLIDDDTKPEVSMEEGRTEEHDESNTNDIHETFVQYVKSNDWDNAIKFLRQHRQLAGNARIPFVLQGDHFRDGTVLHYAILNIMSCSVRIIQHLVDLMASEDLEIQDCFGCTAFYHLINCYPERVEVAECMVKKNHNLLTILPTRNKKALVLVAQGRPKGESMARYLYSLTPPERLRVDEAARLIYLGFYYNRLDIAWDLIQRYPNLVMAIDSNGCIPLVALANNRFAFKSGSWLSIWENLIYYGISIKPLPTRVNVRKPQSDHSDQMYLSNKKENQRHLISSGIGLFQRLVANLRTLLGINRIYQMKLMHERVKQLLPLMCKAASVGSMSFYKRKKLDAALCVAAERGHVEYIANFLGDDTYPVFGVTNEKGQSLLQIAAECRQHKVYNFIYLPDQLPHMEDILGLDQSDKIRIRVGMTDDFGNNLLHAVASITPLSQIGHIQGATLQMQRELQWFKEVESIADPNHCESVNKYNKIPRKVFTENHKELGKEAEKSMKETSTSCTVVGALIITITFVAAFTVPGPGENDENAGFPTFLTNKVFTTFIVSDAISLFSSTTSVIMFLGILTSRYSEDDFYKSLPIKMIIGLFTLFLSIASMMIVFSCGLYIMLDGKSSIVIPSILLASVPVTSFIWMQFPLLVELFISTFGWGIFDREQKKLF